MCGKLTAQPQTTDGIKEFRSVLADFKTLSSLAMKGTMVAPAAALWMHVGLPSPPLVALITSIMVLATEVWVFQSWYRLPLSRIQKRMSICLAAMAVLFFLFLGMIGAFTMEAGAKGTSVIEGFAVRSDVKALLSSSYSESDALRDSAYDAEQVWTRSSILTVTFGLEGIWVAAFMCFAAFLCAFIIMQRRRPSQGKAHSPQ